MQTLQCTSYGSPRRDIVFGQHVKSPSDNNGNTPALLLIHRRLTTLQCKPAVATMTTTSTATTVLGNQRTVGLKKTASREVRIARTILIVVGCFVICWVPFTIIYLLQFRQTCTIGTGCVPLLLFSVCFWAGYANSAVNPIIYALFSNDLRRAFRQTLHLCTRHINDANSTTMNALSYMLVGDSVALLLNSQYMKQ
jgi:hypothetical protein